MSTPVYNEFVFAYLPTSYSGAYAICKGILSIAPAAFIDCKSLTNIHIPNSVTSIGEGAFYNCSSLTSVSIPDSVTSIGDWAFCNCYNLVSVKIPNNVKSIGNSAFSGVRDIVYSGSATGSPWGAKGMNGDYEKAKVAEQRKLIEKRVQEREQTKKDNRRIVIFIIVAIIGLVMLFNAKCAKTKSNHHYDHFDPSMEYRHSD